LDEIVLNRLLKKPWFVIARSVSDEAISNFKLKNRDCFARPVWPARNTSRSGGSGGRGGARNDKSRLFQQPVKKIASGPVIIPLQYPRTNSKANQNPC
jgi:hypothetical protein